MINKIWEFMQGKKTYAVLSVGVIHQGLKAAGIDVPQENLSITIDVLSLVLGMIFRAVAKK